MSSTTEAAIARLGDLAHEAAHLKPEPCPVDADVALLRRTETARGTMREALVRIAYRTRWRNGDAAACVREMKRIAIEAIEAADLEVLDG